MLNRKTSKRKSNPWVVVENMGGKIDMLVEGQIGLQRQINSMEEKSDDFKKEVNFKFEVVTDSLNGLRNEMHAGFAKVDQEFEVVDTKFEAVFDKLKEQSTWNNKTDKCLSRVENNLATKVGRSELDFRLAQLEPQS